MQNHTGTNKVIKKTSDFTRFMLAVMHKKDTHEGRLSLGKAKKIKM